MRRATEKLVALVPERAWVWVFVLGLTIPIFVVWVWTEGRP